MVQIWQVIKESLKQARWQRLALLTPFILLLTGCLQYDLTLRFDHHNHGQIVQTITLSERWAAVASTTVDPWLTNLKERVGQLGGKLVESDQRHIQVAVPFTTGADLAQRFDQLFADDPETLDESFQTLTLPELGQVPFHLDVTERNWGLASYTHLSYDLDLTTLPSSLTNSSERNPMVDSVSSGLRFRLQTPLGISRIPETSAPPEQLSSSGAIWLLQPGAQHHLEANFWVPNAVGISAVLIAFLVLAGYFVRYRVLKRPKLS
jgi:hypothetical protein